MTSRACPLFSVGHSFEADNKTQEKAGMAVARAAPRCSKRASTRIRGQHMFGFLRMTAAVLVTAGCVSVSLELGSAEAACQLITATHSAATKAEAAQTSRALAVQSAYQLKSTRRWSYVTLSARRVKGDPFWKAVRPNGVPRDAQLKPDLVSSHFYTTLHGVVVPYVCTTGSTVCGR